MRRLLLLLVAGAVLALTGCTADPDAAPDNPPSSGGSVAAEGPGPNHGPPTPGNARTAVDPEPALLAWSPTDQPVDRTVVAGGGLAIGITDDGRAAHLTGSDERTVRAPQGFVVSEALLDEEYAVLVLTDRRETAPARALVLPRDGDAEWRIDGDATAPTTTGGAWALGQGRVLYASTGSDGAYCLAEADLAERATRVRWCAPESSGFSNLEITPKGTTLLTFDDARPSCRTPAWLPRTGDPVPVPGPEPCAGWDALWLGAGGDSGLAWTDVPEENDVGASVLTVTDGASTSTVGRVLSGSLVWCAGAAYASQEQSGDHPARLLRWSPGQAPTVAYEAPRGESLISAPRCGGDQLTVSVLSTSGDEQVTAVLR